MSSPILPPISPPTSSVPFILLRGLTRETRHWGAFVEALRAACPAAPVRAVDLPGNGSLHAQTSPLAVPAMAEALRRALRDQGCVPPYRAVAMSLGAMVVMAWACEHPDELASATLINTSLRGFSRFDQRLRPAQYPTLLRLAAHDPQAGASHWEAAILRMTSRRAAADADRAAAVLRDWTAWRREYPVTRANALRQLIAAARYRAPAQAPAVPLQVLCSARDALVDPDCSRRLARAWGLPISEHADAGHDLPLDDPAWTAAQIQGFVAGLPPR